MEPKKIYRNGKLYRKLIGIFFSLLCYVFAFLIIDRLRNYWGLLFSLNTVIFANIIIDMAFPKKRKKL